MRGISLKIIGIFLIYSSFLFAGEFSSTLFSSNMRNVLVDSSKICHDETVFDTLFTDKPLKNPLRPMIASAIMPGLGQWFNGKKYKGIFFFVSEIALTGYIVHLDRINSPNRSDFTWLLGLFHAYNILDAVVDAYLYGFDKILPEENKNEKAKDP